LQRLASGHQRAEITVNGHSVLKALPGSGERFPVLCPLTRTRRTDLTCA
jgi:hypothetical protein